MSVYKKLNEARIKLQSMSLKKSGNNKFAGYSYFELGDFLPACNQIFSDLGLCDVISFGEDLATMTIYDIDTGENVTITSPMGSAALKGCHEVQNIGAVETYQRRYLWVAAMGIVEHDALDSVTGSDQGKPNNDKAAYDALVIANMSTINEIKTALANDDFFTARCHWNDFDEETKMALWKAPSKNGVFTTVERNQMKSSEFRTATQQEA